LGKKKSARPERKRINDVPGSTEIKIVIAPSNRLSFLRKAEREPDQMMAASLEIAKSGSNPGGVKLRETRLSDPLFKL